MWTEQTLVDPYKYYPNVLSIIERDKLVQEFIDLGGVDKQQDKIFNRTNFRLKALSEKFDSKLKELINDANQQFNVELFDNQPFERWNLSTYSKGGCIKTHNDVVRIQPGWQRKLTIIILIYKTCEGGELLIEKPDDLGKGGNLIEFNPGDVVVLPSYINHEVTEVTKGTRQSLTSWVLGPPYK